MASSLPSESTVDKAVQTFGLGTYDDSQILSDRGENSNERMRKRTLPDDGGSISPDDGGPDNPDNRLLGYPQTFASADLPGDSERQPSGWLKTRDVVVNRVPTVSQSELPSGGSVPRADYYDKMSISYSGDEWPDEDSGAWASESEESIPTPGTYDQSRENSLGALGNSWSGYIVQDQSVPSGFPSDTYLEDYTKFNHMNASERPVKKFATNFNLVRFITADFIKDHGKKDITRRNIMAFLQKTNNHQYLASDIVRCLMHDHEIYVKDVLDEFPVVRSASTKNDLLRLSSIRDNLIELEIRNIRNPEVSSVYRSAAAAMTHSIVALERIGNG